jgi:phosphopantetheine binding protein
VADPVIDDTGRAVRAAWVEHLGAAAAAPDANFFAVGGNSLLAASILGGLSERFGRSLPLGLLVRNPTLAGLCAAVDDLLAE